MGLFDNIFSFTFNVKRQEIILKKGETALVSVWKWRKFQYWPYKAITVKDDGTIKVTYI